MQSIGFYDLYVIATLGSCFRLGQTGCTADVSGLEAVIDCHVYRLYGLSEAEIRLVEGG